MKTKFEPGVLVEDITKITEQEWLAYRRKGIGGSDCAIVFGASPWRTTRELYWDKKGIKDLAPTKEESNWVAKEVGHRLEELVAQIFMKKTGLQPYAVRKMFYHPDYPWMLADVDFFVKVPVDGVEKIYILEIKTTSINALDAWGDKNSNVIPYHYELQGRHYMATTNVDGVIFCCLAGNTEDGFIMRTLTRDMAIEQDIIEIEMDFWNNYVQKDIEPPFIEKPDMVLAALQKHYGRQDAKVELPVEMYGAVNEYLKLAEEKTRLNKELKAVTTKMQGFIIPISDYLKGAECTAVIDGETYEGKYTDRTTYSIPSASLSVLKLKYPDAYAEFVETRTSSSFAIKKAKKPKAKSPKKTS